MAKKTLTKDDILHIAKLANLHLNDTEVTRLENQLSETISYVENLHELDTSKVDTTAYATSQKNIYFADGTTNERLLSQEDALSNSQKHNDRLFTVTRIMNDE